MFTKQPTFCLQFGRGQRACQCNCESLIASPPTHTTPHFFIQAASVCRCLSSFVSHQNTTRPCQCLRVFTRSKRKKSKKAKQKQMTSLAGTDFTRFPVQNTPDRTKFYQISTPHNGRVTVAPLPLENVPILATNFTPNRTDRKHAPFFFHG